MEEFGRGIGLVEGSFVEVGGAAERLLLRVEQGRNGQSLELTCTDGLTMLWTATVSYSGLARQKKYLGLQGMTWEALFRQLKDALDADNVAASLDDEEELELEVNCFVKGESFAFKFELEKESDPQQRIADLLFDMVGLVRRAAAVKAKHRALKEQLEVQTARATRLAAQLEKSPAQAHEPNTVRASAAAATRKRKAGYSLINPSVKKKRAARGVKIAPTDV